MKQYLLLCLTAAFSLNCQANEALKLTLDQCQPKFQIGLAANPTTGYQWVLKDYDHKHFKWLTSTYKKSEKQLMGSGGTVTFSFALNKGASYPKDTSIILRYAQPWEPKSGSYQLVIIHFKPCEKANTSAPNTSQ